MTCDGNVWLWNVTILNARVTLLHEKIPQNPVCVCSLDRKFLACMQQLRAAMWRTGYSIFLFQVSDHTHPLVETSTDSLEQWQLQRMENKLASLIEYKPLLAWWAKMLVWITQVCCKKCHDILLAYFWLYRKLRIYDSFGAAIIH